MQDSNARMLDGSKVHPGVPTPTHNGRGDRYRVLTCDGSQDKWCHTQMVTHCPQPSTRKNECSQECWHLLRSKV